MPDKSKGKSGKRCRKQGGMRAPAVGVSVQARDAMRVAWGAGAAHLAPGATYRHEELCDGVSPLRGGHAAAPPRGFEPQPLPTIRPTGAPKPAGDSGVLGVERQNGDERDSEKGQKMKNARPARKRRG